jgi:hypothetical protein
MGILIPAHSLVPGLQAEIELRSVKLGLSDLISTSAQENSRRWKSECEPISYKHQSLIANLALRPIADAG